VWSAKIAAVSSGKHARGDFATRGEATLAKFEAYLSQVAAAGGNSVLVVSGTGPKKELDAVKTLQHVAEGDVLVPAGISLGCAFNPHIGGELDTDAGEFKEKATQIEWNRLEAKLKTGAVASVWLQFGADLIAIDKNLARLTTRLAQEPATASIRVIGSLFIPSKAWLAKMRFRCWAGCYLGGNEGEYLSSIAQAVEISQRLVHIYRRFDVEVVVESSIRSTRELQECGAFLHTVGGWHGPVEPPGKTGKRAKLLT